MLPLPISTDRHPRAAPWAQANTTALRELLLAEGDSCGGMGPCCGAAFNQGEPGLGWIVQVVALLG